MDGSNSPDYRSLYRQQQEELRQQQEELRQQQEELRRAQEERRLAEERTQQTTFDEFIRACHVLMSIPLKIQDRKLSTKGSLTAPVGRLCPRRLRPWVDFPDLQQKVYRAVCDFLLPSEEDPQRHFLPLFTLETLGNRRTRFPLSSEKSLDLYQANVVEECIYDIVARLCAIPAAQEEFALGGGLRFENHDNMLDEDEEDTPKVHDHIKPRRPRPDQFCVHQVDDDSNRLIMTGEHKAGHKLSAEYMCAGLRPMGFWEEVVQKIIIPTAEEEKLKYHAERLTGAALTQQFHVMIHEGLEYSYITNGKAYIFLTVRKNDPETLYYYFAEPNRDVDLEDEGAFRQPRTAIARLLCFCLIALRAPLREQKWRNSAVEKLPVWKTDFDHILAQIPEDELHKSPPVSEYHPSPLSSPSADVKKKYNLRSRTTCAPANRGLHQELLDSSDSDAPAPDSHQVTSRKRNAGEITSSSIQRPNKIRDKRKTPSRRHVASFCTLRCLKSLSGDDGVLDDSCPNVKLHRQSGDGTHHPLNAAKLVELCKQQLDRDLDHYCTPFESPGSYGAPFKITCMPYGYTVFGKGTTDRHWDEVKQEADVYRVLQHAQCSAVPVFLGCITLNQTYFLHGAGQIRHMLLMAWGGERASQVERTEALMLEIKKSLREIRQLGVEHGDLHLDNILWNAELSRALIIDFHRCKLKLRVLSRKSTKRNLKDYEPLGPKRHCTLLLHG